ncbi:unnamed protein product [Prunus armeniaca]|uniref:Uncharacterized protein n=1 Tax=Prunus armeniaca TaxID=36596 RepID=A0A6J5WB68_PRUAR|nr:unnamed protein product [Prunus armeniaca]
MELKFFLFCFVVEWIGGGGRAGSLEVGMLRDWRALSWFGSKELEDGEYGVVGLEFGGVEEEVRDGVGGEGEEQRQRRRWR